MECPIWGTEAKATVKYGTGDFLTLDSPRAGGLYRVTGTVAGRISALSAPQKKLLTSWLVEQRRLGVEVPEIHSDNLDIILQREPLSFTQRIAAALLFFSRHLTRLDETISISSGTPDALTNELVALTECQNAEEIDHFLTMLESIGLLHARAQHFEGGEYAPTPAGWQQIEEFQRAPKTESTQAFIAMWFDEKTHEAYAIGIAPAIIEAGYKPLRIDRKEHVNKIDDEIIAEIRRSRFLVADFTCEPEKSRGGVYFEAGFAMALPIPVIWTCHKASFKDVHFDTRQFNHIVWEKPADLYKQLLARVGAVIGDGPLRKLAG
jgi:hypothetical protein